MRGRPVLGALCGLLLGGFVALDLQQFAIRPLDTTSVIGLPVLGLVVGLLLGLLHPFRPGRRGRANMAPPLDIGGPPPGPPVREP